MLPVETLDKLPHVELFKRSEPRRVYKSVSESLSEYVEYSEDSNRLTFPIPEPYTLFCFNGEFDGSEPVAYVFTYSKCAGGSVPAGRGSYGGIQEIMMGLLDSYGFDENAIESRDNKDMEDGSILEEIIYSSNMHPNIRFKRTRVHSAEDGNYNIKWQVCDVGPRLIVKGKTIIK